jgi:methyl-accepting chemotaxis protein
MLNEDKADHQKQQELILALRENTKEKLDKMDSTLRIPKARELLKQLQESNAQYLNGQKELIKVIEAGTPEEAKAYLANKLKPILAGYKKAISE